MVRSSFAMVLVAFCIAAPAAATLAKPHLHVVSASPLRVRGTSFRPRETVTVTLVSPVRRTRRLVVTSTGTFLTSLGQVPNDPCTGFLLRAIGASGDRALIRGPGPQCPPP